MRPWHGSIIAAFVATALSTSTTIAGAPGPSHPNVGLFEGGGVRVELAAAGTAASGAPEYIARIDVDGRRLRGRASGARKLSGLMGEGEGAISFSLEVVGDAATFTYSGKTVALSRGRVHGADAPPPAPTPPRPATTREPRPAQPDRVVVAGRPPLMRSAVEAHVDVNEWFVQLLLGDYELRFDEKQRAEVAAQLVRSYPAMSPEQRRHITDLPGLWSQVSALWRQVGAEGRAEVAATYRARWLAAQQAAMSRMPADQRASHQHWVRTAEAVRTGDLGGAERMAAERARLDARWNRSLAEAKARQGRGSGAGGAWTRADTQRHLSRSMTNHFVYSNMQRMTFNSYRTGFATLNP